MKRIGSKCAPTHIVGAVAALLIAGGAGLEGAVERAIEHYERGIVGTPAEYVGVRVNLARL
jgi:hypothetical protein